LLELGHDEGPTRNENADNNKDHSDEARILFSPTVIRPPPFKKVKLNSCLTGRCCWSTLIILSVGNAGACTVLVTDTVMYGVCVHGC
jgi:hypothetical protein